jgi:hypothetical protein
MRSRGVWVRPAKCTERVGKEPCLNRLVGVPPLTPNKNTRVQGIGEESEEIVGRGGIWECSGEKLVFEEVGIGQNKCEV